MRPLGQFAGAVLDDLHRQINAIDARRIEALVAMREANKAGDDDAWDRAAQTHDDLSDERADINGRIEELEAIEARAEEREHRSAYFQSVL